MEVVRMKNYRGWRMDGVGLCSWMLWAPKPEHGLPRWASCWEPVAADEEDGHFEEGETPEAAMAGFATHPDPDLAQRVQAAFLKAVTTDAP